ncbi:MAG: MFS transporter [Chloroflexi bacterium]|nr:MFS transporter [Chloroflexota bacterium]MBP8059508.1 MFS transporter [Chloroflexota bacterium]
MTTNRQRWLYALANMATVIPYQAMPFAQFYYTDIKHLPVAWVSNLLFLFAFYNAANNPIIGYLSDRTRTRWGRRLPFILFGTAPMAVFFTLIWVAPFDGLTQPGLLIGWFAITLIFWELGSTAIGTSYFALLPEMFVTYAERTDIAVRMNIFQTIGLLVGVALPPILYSRIGWVPMGLSFALVCAAAMYIGLPGMFERPEFANRPALDLLPSLKATFINRSFATIVAAYTLRYFAISTLATGVPFYIKYSLKVDDALASAILASAFITAGLLLWPWRQYVAHRFEARTTMMLAFLIMAAGAGLLFFVRTIGGAVAAAMLFGVGLSGMILMTDVILADIADEDEMHTGLRREGMYFGMNGFITSLSFALVALVFRWLPPAYGYDSTLTVQPDSVAIGFRLYMSLAPAAACLLAIIALYLYPLHGSRLRTVKTFRQQTFSDHL